MKRFSILSTLFAGLLTVAVFSASPAVPATKVTYACPMHPEVTSDRPGKCPKCGMFLEAEPTEATCYACPMHPEVKEDKPGKCPKCGMNLEKRTEKVSYTYSCPMHPEVTADGPGKCPKCGMFLEAHPASQGRSGDAPVGHRH